MENILINKACRLLSSITTVGNDLIYQS